MLNPIVHDGSKNSWTQLSRVVPGTLGTLGSPDLKRFDRTCPGFTELSDNQSFSSPSSHTALVITIVNIIKIIIIIVGSIHLQGRDLGLTCSFGRLPNWSG